MINSHQSSVKNPFFCDKYLMKFFIFLHSNEKRNIIITLIILSFNIFRIQFFPKLPFFQTEILFLLILKVLSRG